MRVQVPYGRDQVAFDVPDQALIRYPPDLSAVDDVAAEVQRAMANPIGSPPLREIARGRSDAAIVINDITRPAPSRVMLHSILQELQIAGIGDESVTVVIATGNHRPNTAREIEEIIGQELAQRLRVINHDCGDRAQLSRIEAPGIDMAVWVNSCVANAQVKILTGLITPHQSAGFSGGRKSLAPGVAGLETIARHHSFPIRPYGPAMAWMHGNPFHEVALQLARAVGVDFILNVVKNWQGHVVHAVAGDLVAAHEAGVHACEQSWILNVPRTYDVVVVSPGGYPRDIDLHQAQKAIASAEMVVADGGVIVLMAECRDGVGKFAAWFKDAKDPESVIGRFEREGFTPDHSSKAFMCARVAAAHTVIVASSINRPELERLFFRFAASAQEAVDSALDLKGRASSILVLPYAVDCVPRAS